MVIVSLDEGGSGVLAYKDARTTESLPIFTLAYYQHKYILKKLNQRIFGVESSGQSMQS